MSWIKISGAGYWTIFVATFLAVAIWESFQPRRPLSSTAERRWGRHALLFIVSYIAQAAVVRISPVLMAAAVAHSRFGILNRAWLPFGVQSIAAIILLDLVHYVTHRAFHAVPLLWRVHEVHHSDPDYDVSTAARFHPIEVVSVQGAYLAAVALLAPPPIAVFLSELLSVVLNLFAHANASFPAKVEKWLGAVFMTPDVHRIHHSADEADHSRNLGQTFVWWDRIFGTYLGQPRAGAEEMITGIHGLRTSRSLGLGFMLAEPFQSRGQKQTDPASGRPGPD